MYRVRLHYNRTGEAYHKRCLALQKYAPDDFEVTIARWHPCDVIDPWPAEERPDLILQLVPDHEAVRQCLDERGLHETVLVGGLNVGWGHHEKRLKMCQAADHIVVNNEDLHRQLGEPEGTAWISNGVDLDIYRVKILPGERQHKVLWLGGDYHSGTKTDIKGYFSHLVPLAHELACRGIPVNYRRIETSRDRLDGENLIDWYNSGTVYACASSSEGTPNPALEAAACGCVVVSTPVGNMPELIQNGVNGELVPRDVDAMADAIVRCIEDYPARSAAMQKTIAGWHWRDRAQQYYDLFRRLIMEAASPSRRPGEGVTVTTWARWERTDYRR